MFEGVIATVLGSFAVWLLARGGRIGLGKIKSWRHRRHGFRLPRADYFKLIDGIGESELVGLTFEAVDLQTGESTLVGRETVEIETPDGANVWQVPLKTDTEARNLALAARHYFKLKNQYYRLAHKPSGSDFVPSAIVAKTAHDGDRLALVPHGAMPWGWSTKPSWWRRLLGRVKVEERD